MYSLVIRERMRSEYFSEISLRERLVEMMVDL